MLAIKLSRVGKKNNKLFRLVISEKSRDPFGKVLENLGSYNPYTKELQSKDDRIKHWLGKGAQMTATVNNLLVGKGIVEGQKVSASKAGQKSEKRAAQLKTKADKKAAPAAAPEAPAETSTEVPAETSTETPAATEAATEAPAEATE